MFIILVYDTAAERNPRVIKTCRRYLHWVQRSVFQGELSVAQHRSLMAELISCLDVKYDSIRAYRVAAPQLIDLETVGLQGGHTDSIV